METLQAALAVQAQYWGGCLGRAALRVVLARDAATHRRVRVAALPAPMSVPAVLAVWASTLVEAHAQVGMRRPGCRLSWADGSRLRTRELSDTVAERVSVMVLARVSGEVRAGSHVDFPQRSGGPALG